MQILDRRSDLSILDAIMASTAAPTYFPSYHGFVDGGMAANDPSAVAYAACSGKAQALLSFGTGYVTHEIPQHEDWGALSWLLNLNEKKDRGKTPLLSLLFDVQEELAGKLCSLLLKEDYLRLNLKLESAVPLDDCSQIPSLIEKTQSYIKTHQSWWETICRWTKQHYS